MLLQNRTFEDIKMEYKLRNGYTIIVRKPLIEDAEAIVNRISAADTETKFLARNPGEFCITPEQEKIFISDTLNDNDKDWFVAEYKGKIIGNCSVGLVSKNERYRHRAEVTFVVLKDYCGMGIGGKLMQQCISWCKDRNIMQIELSVSANNKRAITMYEGFGFKVMGTVPNARKYPDGTFVDEKLMILEL